MWKLSSHSRGIRTILTNILNDNFDILSNYSNELFTPLYSKILH